MEVYLTALRDLVNNSGFSVLFSSMGTGNLVMLVVALVSDRLYFARLRQRVRLQQLVRSRFRRK